MMASKKTKEALLFTFTNDDIESLVLASGRKIKNGHILEEDGKKTKCSCCNKPLQVEHVGRFMPGSVKIICDNPLCINEYLIDKMV